jgi:uncharacterized OB-fold protein
MSDASRHADGVVYSETVVHAPPAQFAADAPYQLAMIDLETVADGVRRATVRILADTAEQRVQIGDRVRFVEERDAVLYYAKIQP